MNISDLMNSANSFSDNATKAAGNLFDLNLDAAISASADAKTQTDIGVNNTIIQGAQQTSELATQTAKIAGANALGTNLKDQSQVLTGLSENILSLMGQRTALAQTIAQKQSVGFFDDPLQHILNQFTINDDIDKHNAVNEQLNEATDSMDTLNKLTQSTNATQDQLKEPITAAAMAASAANTADTASLASQKAQRDALQYNAQGITSALSMTKEALNTQFQAVNAVTSQQNVQIALDHLSLARQEFDWKQQEKTLADAARNKNTDIDTYTLGRINDGLTRMGMQTIPPGSPRAGSVLAAIKGGQASGTIYGQAFQISTDSEAAGGATILAPSPAGAIDLLSKLPLTLTPAQAPVKDLLDQATQLTAQDPNVNPKDLPSVRRSLNQNATNLLAAQSKKIVPGDSSNVFQVPPLGAVINAAPALQNLPVVAKVIAPLIASGADISNPDIVFHSALTAVEAGTITIPDMIEGLATTYQTAVKVNLEARQLQSLGLNLNPKKPGDPSTMTYNVPITTGPLNQFSISSRNVIDMTDMVAISRNLNKMMAIRNNPFIGGI